MYDMFFWLHIKKSAGISTRQLLHPYYLEVDRTRRPKCFLQASREEYNDILNNFRTTLGEYQFKRCLFAKKYLYPNSWEKMFSFAFSREPIDRCCSMFHYLFWKDGNLKHRLQQTIKRTLSTRKLQCNAMYAFDVFLDLCKEARTSSSIYVPIDNHFTTHTAPMFDDITDLDGNLLLTKVFRLANLSDAINQVFEECGLEKRIKSDIPVLNRNMQKVSFIPSRSQVLRIQEIYNRDFEVYEAAG